METDWFTEAEKLHVIFPAQSVRNPQDTVLEKLNYKERKYKVHFFMFQHSLSRVLNMFLLVT